MDALRPNPDDPDLSLNDGDIASRGDAVTDGGRPDLGPGLARECEGDIRELLLCAADLLDCPELGPDGRRYAAVLDDLVSACAGGEGLASVLPLDDLACESKLEAAASVGIGFEGICSACPEPAVAQSDFRVVPLSIVRLDASPSRAPDSEIARYEWALILAPATSSQAGVFERFRSPGRPENGGPEDDPVTPTAEFFADVSGVYVFELRVINADGLTSPGEFCQVPAAQVRIEVVPDQDVYIQLTWDTPGDADQRDAEGSDFDLHLLHPRGTEWDRSPLDCYYANKTPDWGPGGPSGNATLDLDDTTGLGPEVIHIEAPEDTLEQGSPYQVGAHYYRAESFLDGIYGASTARVQVFLGVTLAFDGERLLEGTDNFWQPVNIDWVDGVGAVVPVDRLFQRMP